MNPATEEIPGPSHAEVKWITNLAGALLLAAALAAGMSFLADRHSMPPADPLLQWPAGWVSSLVAAMCLVAALVCLLAESTRLKIVLLFWLASNAAIYALGCRWVSGSNEELYAWLVPFGNAFGLPPTYGFWLLVAVWAYLLIASLVPWLWPGLRSRLGLAEYLKASCPDCGGHIKFPISSLGQKISCPHCRAAITLCQPDLLKMNCFFCREHIEFPAHAIGVKISCPHCKMDITLKEPT